jgi:hypothetical protein
MLPIMLQVNGNVTLQPLVERGPLLGSREQVAADLDQANDLASSTSTGTLTATPLSQLPLWSGCVAADRSCGSPTPMHVGGSRPDRRLCLPASAVVATALALRWQTLLIARQPLEQSAHLPARRGCQANTSER